MVAVGMAVGMVVGMVVGVVGTVRVRVRVAFARVLASKMENSDRASRKHEEEADPPLPQSSLLGPSPSLYGVQYSPSQSKTNPTAARHRPKNKPSRG